MTARPGDRRCPQCGYLAALHDANGFDGCDTPASLIPITVDALDNPRGIEKWDPIGEFWYREPLDALSSGARHTDEER